jgi:signal transduction histidine kinase
MFPTDKESVFAQPPKPSASSTPAPNTLKLFRFAIIAGAGCALAVAFLASAPPSQRALVMFLTLALASALAQWLVVAGPAGQSYTFGEAFVVAGTLLLPPGLAGLVAAPSTIVDAWRSGRGVSSVLGNSGNLALSCLGAWAIAQLCGGLEGTQAGLIAAAAAAITFVALNYAMVAVFGRLRHGTWVLSKPAIELELIIAITGSGFAVAWHQDPRLLAVAALPIVLIRRLLHLPQIDAEHRRQELELATERRLVAKLREIDEAKEEFFAHVTHELRNPLVSVGGYAELLRDGELDNEQRGFVEVIERNAAVLLRIVGDLLFVARADARLENMAQDELDITKLADIALTNARPRAEAVDISLALTSPGSSPLICGDPLRLGQVLDNLISNAIKFTPAGGMVRAMVSEYEDSVQLAIADSGIGIPAQDVTRLFGRFFRASNVGSVAGTGLGLAVTKAILDRHHATIEVTSEVGVGTTFTITFPVARAVSLPGPGPEPAHRGPTTNE